MSCYEWYEFFVEDNNLEISHVESKPHEKKIHFRDGSSITFNEEDKSVISFGRENFEDSQLFDKLINEFEKRGYRLMELTTQK